MAGVRAQAAYIQEDFGAGATQAIPAGWLQPIVHNPGTNWYAASGGINPCSLPAHQGSSLLCNDERTGGCGISHDTSLFTVDIPYVPGEELRVRFDYTLDIDLGAGDRAVLRLTHPAASATISVPIESSDLNLFLTGPGWQLGHELVVPASTLQAFQDAGSFRLEFFLKVNAPSSLRRGWGIDNLLVEPVAAIPYCFGDGTGEPCPCGNLGATGEGCANATGTGARLDANGTLSVSRADLQFTGTNLPPSSFGVFFQGDAAGAPPASLGNGLLCLGGSLTRLEIVPTDVLGFAASSVAIPAAGGATVGQTLHYQLHYREDPATAPCSQASNLSNALEVTWAP